MMKKKRINHILHNDQGIALLMVVGFITILSALLVDFSFETTINKSKAYNSQDRVQARLNAESGLNFALGQLKIYQMARNALEKNKNAKGLIKPALLESTLTQPFIYPIPSPDGATISQKDALKEFEEETYIQGAFQLYITPVKGFLNPNNLRVSPPKQGEDNSNNISPADSSTGQNNANKKPHEYMEEKMVELIVNTIEEFKEANDPFIRDFPNIEPKLLVKELKLYVNNPNYVQDPEKFDILSLYNQAEVIPKHAPMTSLEEMHYLVGWPDYLLNKIKKQFTVHEVGFISLNDLDLSGLKLLFPRITPEQTEEFFRYRDGDKELNEDPNPFTSVDEFKNLIVQRLAVVNATDFDNRAKEFEQANLKLGVAGKLYKVTSIGVFNSAKVTLTAYVDLPAKEPPKQTNNTTAGNAVNGQTAANPDDDDTDNQNDQTTTTGTAGNTTPKDIPLELLSPRVIEVQVD